MHNFNELRKNYPVFRYDDYHMVVEPGSILLTFDFSVPGLAEFHPQTRIYIDNLPLLNNPLSDTGRAIVFALGLVESVSYYKAVCCPTMEISCGALDEKQVRWWKKLWFNGLGEFFYRNGIETDEESFVTVKSHGITHTPDAAFKASDAIIVPIGGGKDSAVSLSLLKSKKDSIFGFTVNDQPARTETLLAAGLSPERMIRTQRTIDPELLRLNKEGFLNGHTPFSAIVAFLSSYCAYLIGAENIVLSNESSANESNIQGTNINHQYSKSYAFEQDFTSYVRDYFSTPIRYFSLLRPFNEMQIAKQFAALPQYHAVFKSCNVGSKKNIWCGNCAKCLFVFCILSPFLSPEKLCDIFGENLLNKPTLLADFEGLCGISDVKPFECIGTVREVRAAILQTIDKYRLLGLPLPLLLAHCEGKFSAEDDPLQDFNSQHNVPEEFLPFVKEMHRFVLDM